MKATRKYSDSRVWTHPCRDCFTLIESALGGDGHPLNPCSDEGPVCKDCWLKLRHRRRERWHGWAVLREAHLKGETTANL